MMHELKTTIQDVTVFTHQARLTRKGEINLELGSHQIAIHDLPLTLDPDSVRARARGTAHAKLMGVEIRRSFFKDTPPGRALELIEAIRTREEEDRGLSDQLDTIDQTLHHLDGLAANTKTFAVSLSRGKTTIEAHSEFIKFIADQRRAHQSQTRDIHTQKRDVVSEIEKLKKELQQIQAARPKERFLAVIDLEVKKPGSLEVELTYLQAGARWEPVYDIRLEKDALNITYLGQVTQSTGEDWAGVTLTLSTASPALAGVNPELDPWYIAPFIPRRIEPKIRGAAIDHLRRRPLTRSFCF
ncbi:MAG: mucoidy inhibitor MuiA family protein [Anaerolineae bacterium]|nr:mucoidy inhibitor MuiA family protein [Anaerolineae bacterium]